MTRVRAVTPRLPALHGRTYVHRAGCTGDCCNFDALTDDIATGEPWDHEYHAPSKRELEWFQVHQRADDARPAPSRVSSADPMQAPAATEGGRDAWRAGAPSSPDPGLIHPGTSSRAGRVAATQGDPVNPPSPRAGSPTPLDEQSRPAGRPDGS